MPDALLIHNANILTMNDAHPRATAMLIRDGRIVALDDDETPGEATRLAAENAEWIDAHGRTITPGFHDCHLHLLWYGTSLTSEAYLVGCASVDDVLDRLSAFAKRTDGWIRGRGFDQEKLAERRIPTRAELDRVSSTRPVFITRVCCHAAVVNSAALALLDDAERRAGDADAGLFTETAIDAFRLRVPPLDDEQLDRALLAACDVALRTGITSVGTMLDTMEQWATYARVRSRLGRLPVRVTAMPPESAVESLVAAGVTTSSGDEWLRVGGTKFFSDGSLGARTALLAAPYADDPSAGVGLRIYPPGRLKRRCAEVAAQGFQVVIHAIGDQALRESIDAIEFALAGASNALPRHRVEHASVCPPDQLERLARLGIYAALQPQFVVSDTWTGDRLGPARTPWAYPFASMRRAGVPIGLSSDCPVEALDAFACLAAAVGRSPWSPDETLAPLDALRAYTLGSAALAHREGDVGSLEIGKSADFVVLNGDPRHMSADQLRTVQAERVFIGGREFTRSSPHAV